MPILHFIGIIIGWLIYWASPSYRKHLKTHVQLAGFSPHLSHAISEAGKSILELPFIWYGHPDRIRKITTIDHWEAVDTALQKNNGVLFLTPHLGCFELIAQVIAQHVPITVLYRPPRKTFLKPLLERARTRTHLTPVPTNLTGVRLLLKALKKGQSVGLLPDQVPHKGEGVWADFFNRPAYTMTLPFKLHDMTGATIMLTYAERLSFGRGFIVHFFPFEGFMGNTPAEHARTLNAAMEQLITRCPAQYFWSYRRYKIPADVMPPSSMPEQK